MTGGKDADGEKDMTIRLAPYPWTGNKELGIPPGPETDTRIPKGIRKCHTKHRTQLFQEFMAGQGIRLLDPESLLRRGWTRSMIHNELGPRGDNIAGTHPLYLTQRVELAETRPDIARAISRNLEARALGGMSHQGGLTSQGANSSEPVRQPIPKGNRKKESRREKYTQGMEEMMRRMPSGRGPLWSR